MTDFLRAAARVALCGAILTPLDSWADATVPIRVAKFDSDRVAALSYTFDDGNRDHYEIVDPMLREFDFRGTFFIVGNPTPDTPAESQAKKPGSFGGVSWQELRELAAHGHEIANHTWTHKQLTKLSDADLRDEIDRNIAAFKEKLGFEPLTFCYPGNGKNDYVRSVVLEKHIAARDFQFEIGTEKMTTADANALADKYVAKGEWGVAMIHGIENGYHPLSSREIFREHLRYVKKNEDKIWVDTFANVARYIAERDAAKLEVEKATAGSAKFVIDTTLKKPPYDVPLTVVIEAPDASEVQAARSGTHLPAKVKDGKILVSAVPDSVPLEVTWK